MRPGDVLLVEGEQRVSQVISYLTTSPWSHAALYLGDEAPMDCTSDACRRFGDGSRHLIVEALTREGVVCAPLAKYRNHMVRICRPRGLSAEDAGVVTDHAARQIGKTYDVDNIVDLARFFLPAGLVPASFRREALHFGAGKPTEVICSSLVASAFARVGYPVLPLEKAPERRRTLVKRLFLRASGTFRVRRMPTTLVVPRDFDLSPYFDVVKPLAPEASGYRKLAWEAPG